MSESDWSKIARLSGRILLRLFSPRALLGYLRHTTVVLIVSGSLVVAFHSFILPQLFDHASVWKAFLGWMIVWTAIHFIYPMRVSNYERDARSRGPSGPERQD